MGPVASSRGRGNLFYLETSSCGLGSLTVCFFKDTRGNLSVNHLKPFRDFSSHVEEKKNHTFPLGLQCFAQVAEGIYLCPVHQPRWPPAKFWNTPCFALCGTALLLAPLMQVPPPPPQKTSMPPHNVAYFLQSARPRVQCLCFQPLCLLTVTSKKAGIGSV